MFVCLFSNADFLFPLSVFASLCWLAFSCEFFFLSVVLFSSAGLLFPKSFCFCSAFAGLLSPVSVFAQTCWFAFSRIFLFLFSFAGLLSPVSVFSALLVCFFLCLSVLV